MSSVEVIAASAWNGMFTKKNEQQKRQQAAQKCAYAWFGFLHFSQFLLENIADSSESSVLSL